ncbi:unnamed protein product [Pylaiella littoralis]
MAIIKQSRRRHSSLTELRCVSAVVSLLAVVSQTEGFYCATSRVGGGASRWTAVSGSSKVSASRWSLRPNSAFYAGSGSPRVVLRASTMEPRDKEAPGEDKKLDTAAEKDSEVVAAPAESRTVQLSKRVEAEGKMADARTKRVVDLNSELKRSFARKEEVENVIASEIAQLGMKLRQERDIEIARAADLKELLKEFGETIAEKQAEIEKEQDLLAQMQALRAQVEEASIRAPIEAAMAKKADVTSIEVMLLEDLVECQEKLKKELESTASRAKTMEGVVEALPAEGDAMRMRAYNWQDVQDLQEVLLSSVESMEASDAQVGSLRTRLLDSVVQKREVLGEASSSTELVLGGIEGVSKKMTTARAFQASQELSEQELLDSIAEASKSTALGVAKSVSVGADSVGTYLRSPAAQDVAASTVLVIGALAGAASSVVNAFKIAKKEFDDNSASGEDLTSFDKIISSLQSSIKAVKESPAVQKELKEAGNLLSNQVPEASVRVGKGAAEALKGAASNSEVGDPVKEALASLEEFVVSLAALGTKYFSGSSATRFQLTDAGGPETDEQKRANAKLPSASPPPKSMEELTAEKAAAAAARKATLAGAGEERKDVVDSVKTKDKKEEKEEKSVPSSASSASSGGSSVAKTAAAAAAAPAVSAGKAVAEPSAATKTPSAPAAVPAASPPAGAAAAESKEAETVSASPAAKVATKPPAMESKVAESTSSPSAAKVAPPSAVAGGSKAAEKSSAPAPEVATPSAAVTESAEAEKPASKVAPPSAVAESPAAAAAAKETPQ